MTQEQILSALDPVLRARITSAHVVNGTATLVVDASGLGSAARSELESDVERAVSALPEIEQVRIALTAEKSVRRILAVASGKGGVGKSTLAANLALALKRRGVKVGLVDADIYGPSQPQILGNTGAKPEAREKQLIPLTGAGELPVLSIGHLVPAGKALAWRGPMTGGALTQLIEADWGDAELLVVDLPPGTGDVQLTMIQKHRPAGVVLVSTPQDLALIDAARAGQLFDGAGVPIIGLVENMSGYACPHCGEVSDPFGSGGVEQAAGRLELPFLGRIPLSMAIRERSDAGTPPALEEGELSAPFDAIAARVAEWLEEPA
ncbi:MAG: Mrp/NBP35 family ATP-binding protein [Sphingomonadaceae bacterium]